MLVVVRTAKLVVDIIIIITDNKNHTMFSSVARRVVRRLPFQQKRGMALGGHHGPAPEWTGVDKVVRRYFPEDYQRTYQQNDCTSV